MPNQPSPPAAQPPPDIPSLPGAPVALVNYLTRFSLWCRNGFAAKLSSNTTLPGVMLMASDAAPGVMPKVFLIQVNTAGTITATAVPPGGGNPPI